jgi:hypothetical protein
VVRSLKGVPECSEDHVVNRVAVWNVAAIVLGIGFVAPSRS